MASTALTDLAPTQRNARLLKVLRKLDLFTGLSADLAPSVLALCEHRSFGEEELVWEAGHPSTEMLILIRGSLEVVDRHGVPTGTVLPGSTVGEMSVITGHPRFVGVRAQEPSVALSLNRGCFHWLATQEPDAYTKILENAVDILAHRLTQTEHEKFRGNVANERDVRRW